MNKLPIMDIPIVNMILLFLTVPITVFIMSYSRNIKDSGFGTVVTFVFCGIIFIPIFLLRDYVQHARTGPWGAFQKAQMGFWSITSFSAGIVSGFATLGVKAYLERKRSSRNN